MDRFGGIIAFVRTAELGSFVRAGRLLNLSPSAVGKSVARLEQELNTRLLQRSTRALRLTEEGREFYERCRRILDDLEDARASLAIARQTPRGRLRVTAPVVGYYLFLHRLPAFIERYPEIEIDLDFSDRITDLIEEGVDIAVRSGALSDSGMMMRRFQPFQHLICASPAYLDRMGEPRVPKDLESHIGLRYRLPNSGKLLDWPLDLPEGEPQPAPRALMTCNNMEALHDAALAGFGVACLPDFLAKETLASGRLKSLLTDYIGGPGQFYLLWPSNRHLSPKIRAFVDFFSGPE